MLTFQLRADIMNVSKYFFGQCNILHCTIEQAKMQDRSSPPTDEESFTTETVDVSYEVEEEEIVEREVIKEVIEERKYPQVKALYNYKGEEMQIAKGEVRYEIHRVTINPFSATEFHSEVKFQRFSGKSFTMHLPVPCFTKKDNFS